MGTRAQVFIKDTGVYLYQHYDGDCLFSTVKDAISRGLRWDDEEYLTRIIFCEMIKNDVNGETGYGIGKEKHGDIEYLVTVDCDKHMVTNERYGKIIDTFDFEDVIKKGG